MNLLSVFFHSEKSENSHGVSAADDSYESLFSESPDAIFVMNQSGQVVSVNRSFQELLGYNVKEINKSNRNGLAGGNEEKVRYHLHKALNGFSTSFEYELIDKKGHTIPVSITFIPSAGEAAKKQEKLIFGVCKELGVLKKYKNEIDAKSAMLEQVQRISKTGIWSYDTIKQEVTWTKQTYSIFGVDEQTFKLTMDNIFARMHPDDGKTCERMFLNSVETGIPFSVEYRLMLENGNESTVYQKAETLLDQSGKVIQVIGIIQDITEQIGLEEALMAQGAQIQLVADRLPIGIWSRDIQKDETTFCSKGVEEIYGVPANRFRENPSLWHEFVHPEDWAIVEGNLERLRQGEELTLEHRIIAANGTVKWIREQIIPYSNQEGKVLTLDAIIQDITEEKSIRKPLILLPIMII